MPCTKKELVSAINSFTSARMTQDNSLVEFAGKKLQECVDSLEFAEEEDTAPPT